MRYPVFICDDDPAQIVQVTETLKRAEQILSDEEKISFDLASQNNYQDAKDYLLSHPVDGGIYFLDVELGQEVDADNGFDLAELIKKQDDRAQIIFLTSHADLSIITYRRRLGPVDYIVKGADQVAQRRRIVETIEVALDQLHKDSVAKQLTFSYRVGRQIKNIRLTDLVYITTTLTPHKLLIVKQAGEAQFLGSLSQCAKENPLLEKISQSCLVNPDKIEAIDLRHHLVTFVNGDVEEYAVGRQKQMKALMQEHDYRLAKLMKQS